MVKINEIIIRAKKPTLWHLDVSPSF